jgi:hypothetical protein
MEVKLQVPLKTGNFLPCWETVVFSWGAGSVLWILLLLICYWIWAWSFDVSSRHASKPGPPPPHIHTQEEHCFVELVK